MKKDTHDLLTRGAADVLPDRRALSERLASGKRLCIKLGLDPTAPDIHLGHAVVLRKLRQFQDLGHTVVLIVGDATAKVGDPSGRSKARPVLTETQIRDHAKTYVDQAKKILTDGKSSLVVRFNSEWLEKLKFDDLLKVMGTVTVAQIMDRDDFQKRMKAGTPVGFHELLYPLLQARDSVAIDADVEIGGTDQTFNMLMGRTLQAALGMTPQVVMTMPLLVGLDGKEKMSKSLGNYVGITDEPNDMYGKVMSIPDGQIKPWLELTTELPADEIAKVLTLKNPRDQKARLAKEIVSLYHGADTAEKAEKAYDSVFRKGGLPEDVQEFHATGSVQFAALVVAAGLAKSKSEARRAIEQGGVRIDGKVVKKWDAMVETKPGMILKRGKKEFRRVI